MPDAHTGAGAGPAQHHDHTPGFVARWLLSTNHKDIGTLYLGYALLSAVLAWACRC